MSAPTIAARCSRPRRGRLLLASACLVLAACGSAPEQRPTPETDPEITDLPIRGGRPDRDAPTPADATGRVPLWLAARELGLTVAATGRRGERRLVGDDHEFVIAAGRSTYTFDGRRDAVPVPGIVEREKALHLPASLVDRMRRDLGGAARSRPTPRREEPRSPTSTALRGFRVVVDAGHGGEDPGAPNRHGPPEKVIALAIANAVVELLRDRGANVTTTRARDTYPSLDDRVEMANRADADVFLSVHANTAANPQAQGVEVFFPDDRRRSRGSGELARLIANAVSAVAGAKNRGPKADERGLRVLENTRMTAVLVETGFLSHAVEGRRLSDGSYQRRVAAGIVRGLEDYVARLP